ncbi:MAG: hypothetical protein U1C46_06965 [Bacteroidales bacterium]|nr:hypothetical protein [Bacteroidales bacterium]
MNKLSPVFFMDSWFFSPKILESSAIGVRIAKNIIDRNILLDIKPNNSPSFIHRQSIFLASKFDNKHIIPKAIAINNNHFQLVNRYNTAKLRLIVKTVLIGSDFPS